MRYNTLILFFVAFFVFTSCYEEESAICGNNIKETGEECDINDFEGKTCRDLGFKGGTLKCNNNCTFDVSSCRDENEYCGDNIVNGNEECDGNNLNRKNCIELGYINGGTLKCTESCHFDKTGCSGTGLCGNGVMDGSDEECDGNDFSGQSCITAGYYGGTLKCNSLCKKDYSECIGAGFCGDGIVQPEYEECDSEDLNGRTCIGLGYNGGNLSCNSSCRFDISSCIEAGFCGDGTIQSEYEECDSSDLNSETCESLGYYGGELFCDDSCKYNMDNCQNSGWCGDGTIQSEHEECDSSDLNSETCESLGYYGGTLNCKSDCTFDISQCQRCGDWIVQTQYEDCELVNLNSKTCKSLGYYGGTLDCNPDCTFDISHCQRCGDGILQQYNGPFHMLLEQCDGDRFVSNSCTYVGYQPGIITNCLPNCKLDTSGCKIRWKEISVGSYHTCGIKKDGFLYCWGANSKGQLGTGNNSQYNTPQRIGNSNDWMTVSAGYFYTCALKNDGSLYCWGRNNYGQLGTGNNTEYHTPQQVGDSTNWIAVSAGSEHTCALKDGGNLYCWGRNGYGQLGTANTTNYNSPHPVIGLSNWSSVSVGDGFTCGIRGNNNLYCWGTNTGGQLGTGNNTEYHTPQQVGNSNDWDSVSSGASHTCGIKKDGSLYCWGSNLFGQLGLNNTNPFTTPQQVGNSNDWDSVSSGASHTCGINNGNLYCWGYNMFGQLGTGNNNEYHIPQQINSDTLQIFLKGIHTCEIKLYGVLYCWGYNRYGELGVGDTTDRNVPVNIDF